MNLFASSKIKIALLSIKHSICVIQINTCEYLVSKYTFNVISKISKNAHWKEAI